MTGADGFIGSHLLAALATHGTYKVFGTTNNAYGLPPPAGIDRYICDLRDRAAAATLLSVIKPDIVVHLAAMLPGKANADIYEVNIGGTLNLLFAMRDNGVKNIIFTSSSNVYGEKGNAPFSESSLTHPNTPYGVAKLAGEFLCQDFADCFDIQWLILRFPGVFGSGRERGVVFEMFSAASHHSDIRIPSDGTDTFSILSIQDAVQTILHGLTSLQQGVSGIFNVSSTTTTSKELADRIVECARSNSKVVAVAEQPSRHLELDDTKVRAKLHFIPGDFNCALQEMVHAYAKLESRILAEPVFEFLR